MKKRWIAIALLTVLLMGIGGAIGKVGVRQESGGSAYALYFVERDLRSADGGDALRSEERTLEDSGLSTEELAAALVTELLKGPADPTLKSPFPKGTALLSAEQKGTELRVVSLRGLQHPFRRGTVSGGLCHYPDADAAAGRGPCADHRGGPGAGLPQPAGVFGP